MKEYIKKQLRDNLTENHLDKWTALEKDVQDAIIPIVEKYKDTFVDSYGVIDAIHQVFDQMFQKVDKR